MLHVGMGPSPLPEPLDRPHPDLRPVRRVPAPVPIRRPVRVPATSPARARARARAARRRTVFLLFAGIIVGGLVFLLVAMQAMVAQTAFRSEELKNRSEQLQREQGNLRLQIAQLESPDRLAKEAAALGLRLPDEIHLVPIPGEGVNVPDRGAGKASATQTQQDALGANP
jgi:cell division protein FtsL